MLETIITLLLKFLPEFIKDMFLYKAGENAAKVQELEAIKDGNVTKNVIKSSPTSRLDKLLSKPKE